MVTIGNKCTADTGDSQMWKIASRYLIYSKSYSHKIVWSLKRKLIQQARTYYQMFCKLYLVKQNYQVNSKMQKYLILCATWKDEIGQDTRILGLQSMVKLWFHLIGIKHSIQALSQSILVKKIGNPKKFTRLLDHGSYLI